MRAPMILPWVARKTGISEELALKLWRRAAGEAETLLGNCNTADYYRLALDRFVALAEEEGASQRPGRVCELVPEPRLTWAWKHQEALSRLSMVAGQNAYRQWQQVWQKYYRNRKAA